MDLLVGVALQAENLTYRIERPLHCSHPLTATVENLTYRIESSPQLSPRGPAESGLNLTYRIESYLHDPWVGL